MWHKKIAKANPATPLAKTLVFSYNHGVKANGDWPSGKALGSGPRIGGSNPSSPAKKLMLINIQRVYISDIVKL
jgi:hypothetical protein